MQMDYIRDCIDYIEKNCSEKRKKHIFAVCETAKALAKHYGVCEDKAYTAALFHDMFREISKEKFNEYVKSFSLGDKYYDNIELAHGKITAIVMKEFYKITDTDILNAVKFHTTGRADMSLLEKIIYIADAAEPGRNYEGADKLRELAFQDINKACLFSINFGIEYVKSKGVCLDEDTILAKEYLEEIKGEK